MAKTLRSQCKGPGSIPGQGTRSRVLSLQILHPVKKMENLACHNQDSAQPDKYINEQLSLPRSESVILP